MPQYNRFHSNWKTVLIGLSVFLSTTGAWAEPTASALDTGAVAQTTEAAQVDEPPAVEDDATDSDEASSEPNKWHGEFTPVVWLANTTTNFSVGDRSRALQLNAADALGNFQAGGTARIEATNDKWGAFADLFFINLEDTVQVGPRGNVPLSIGVDNTVWQVAGTYRVVNKEKFDLDVLAGARGYSIDLDVNVDPFVGPAGVYRAPGKLASAGLSFVDPIIGAKAKWQLSDKWDVDTYADIGGFGAGSDFTYRLGLNFGYAANKTVTLRAGYILMDFDYSQGSGIDKIDYDTTMYGPVLGVGFKF